MAVYTHNCFYSTGGKRNNCNHAMVWSIPSRFFTRKTLREKDPKRFKISQSKNPKILAEETKKAQQLKEYDWAALFAESWVSLQPGSVRAYEDFGRSLIELNQPNKAKEVGRKLINLHKLNHIGYQILGDAHSELGEWEAAKQYYEQALVYTPDPFRQFILISVVKVYESLGLVNEAINVYEEILTLVDDDHRKLSYQKDLRNLQQIATRQAQTKM